MDENEIKPIVQSLDVGAAMPIPINAQDAQNIAKQQQQYQANLEALENNGTLPVNDRPEDHIAKTIAVGSEEAQALNQNMVNQTNDLVKVVEVETSKKTYAIMIIGVAIIFIIIAWELYHYVIQGG